MFAGLDHRLDFSRDVLSKLSPENRAAYAKFDDAFEAALKARQASSPSWPFRERPDAFTKLRFLQADKYNVDAATTRLLNAMAWRVTSGLDEFVDNPNEKLLRRSALLRPRRIVGFDANFCPLMVERLGEFFGSDEAFKGLPLADWIRSYSYEVCEVTAWTRAGVELGGPYQHQLDYIGDLTGLRMYSALRLLPFLQALVKEVEMHFPELGGRISLINAPSIVATLWPLVKKFLDPNTAAKITISSGCPTDTLVQLYGADALPQYLGGRNPVDIAHPPKKLPEDLDEAWAY